MCAKEEYGHQRPGFSYWLGIAKGLGVACKIHGETELMTTFENMMYGYNTPRMDRGN